MLVNFGTENSDYEVMLADTENMYNLQPEKDRSKFLPFGLTVHKERKIYINSDLCLQERYRTLIHELMHAWMWVTGNANHEEYNEDHICEMVASSNTVIYDIACRFVKEELNNEIKTIKVELDKVKSENLN